MSETIKAYMRGPQILQVLHENGPLPIRTLRYMVDPNMRLRRMHEAVERLRKKRLVRMSHNYYYQTSYAKPVLEKLRVALGEPPETFIKPSFRTMDEDQNVDCAVWTKRFRDLFPGAHVVRHYHMEKDPIANTVLTRNENGFEITPNLLVALPNATHPCPLVLAVEAGGENYARESTPDRLIKIASQTQVDGILYICREDTIDHTYQQIKSLKAKVRAHRDKHFGNHFLVFSMDSPIAKDRTLGLVSYDGKPFHLGEWLQCLVEKRSGSIQECVNSNAGTPLLAK